MTRSLPLVRLSAINPLLFELRRRDCDAEKLLGDLNLPTDIPASHELFVASSAIYEFVERTADLAEDPQICFRIGRGLELHRWDPIRTAAESSATLGHVLIRVTLSATEHTSAGRFFLETDGERACFGLKRTMTPAIRPAQNDAFTTGVDLRILTEALKDRWNADQVLCRVVDPDCISKTIDGPRLAKGNWCGARVTFPSSWLLETITGSGTFLQSRGDTGGSLPVSLVESVRTALRPHLGDTDLTVDSAAKICGYDRRRLSLWLREAGTTLSKEIAKLRFGSAEQELVQTDRRIADIARDVGFKDPTTFSRAFKGWTGQSPRAYRRTHTSSS
jgi:AraC-like DNA-binding protein